MEPLLIVFFVGIYFAPIIADQILNGNIRSHVFIVNVTLGWTIICWIYALIWVFQERKRRRYGNYNYH